MLLRPTVLCPIDFSEASRGALRHAVALGEHFYAGVTVLAVDEMLRVPSPLVSGEVWPAPIGPADVKRFVDETFDGRELSLPDLGIKVVEGKAGPAILRSAAEQACDVIVMGTHGRRGLGAQFFGSTTERVLRETSVPVLVTPSEEPGPTSLEALKSTLRRVLAPVDLSGVTARQVSIAAGLAAAFDASLLLLHVVEEPPALDRQGAWLPRLREAALKRVRPALDDLLATVPVRLHPKVDVQFGYPPDVIAASVRDQHADLIVMALHADPSAGTRMGSVTHRVLCQTRTLLLALPPVGPAPAFIRQKPERQAATTPVAARR
jgi:nucleotide-binding universal stress UspA family protein